MIWWFVWWFVWFVWVRVTYTSIIQITVSSSAHTQLPREMCARTCCVLRVGNCLERCVHVLVVCCVWDITTRLACLHSHPISFLPLPFSPPSSPLASPTFAQAIINQDTANDHLTDAAQRITSRGVARDRSAEDFDHSVDEDSLPWQ